MYYQLNTMSVMISFSVSWLERGKSFEKSIKKKTFLQFPRKDSHKKTSVYVLRRRLMKFIWFSVCEKVITLNNKFWVWEKKAVNVKAASQYSKPTVLDSILKCTLLVTSKAVPRQFLFHSWMMKKIPAG